MSFAIPDACMLPTAEQPLRLVVLDALFTAAVRGVELAGSTHARIRLTGPDGLEATVRDLAAWEMQCCSFFTYTVTPEDGGVLLDVKVPAQYADVLASLAGRAAAEESR